MKYLPFFLFALFGFSLTGNAQSIDNSQSKVAFKIGNMGLNTVSGTFTGMKGNIDFNAAELDNTQFDVCIDASTINTGNEKRDKHLKNEDYFHVEKYPEICFQSESIKKKGLNYIAKGKLSMHGVTKDVEISFRYEGARFMGNLTLKRIDYGIGGKGTFMISNKVTMTIVCVLN